MGRDTGDNWKREKKEEQKKERKEKESHRHRHTTASTGTDACGRHTWCACVRGWWGVGVFEVASAYKFVSLVSPEQTKPDRAERGFCSPAGH